MFALRIRNLLLSLAVAAAVATPLTATIAAAAPAGGSPLPNTVESLAAAPQINLDVADGQIAYTYQTATADGIDYWFTITNHGPDAAKIRYELDGAAKNPNTPNGLPYIHHPKGGTVQLKSGERVNVMVHAVCAPALCIGAIGEVKTVGIDPNQSNNIGSSW